MLNENDAREVIGTIAYSSEGEKIGKVGQLFLDDQSGRPEFVTVNTGLFGTKESFVPVSEATFGDDRLTVPFAKGRVKDAPHVDLDAGHLNEAEEQRLYEYYGLSAAAYAGTQTLDDPVRDPVEGDSGDSGDRVRGEGRDMSGPNTDDAMTRSEEQLHVSTTSQEAGRARLRKYVTVEEETHTVPVRKERAVLETEPITEDNVDAATSGKHISEEEHEVTLTEERAVVEKEAVPVERVRLGTETTVEEESVTEEVRKEHIETEGDVDKRP